MHHDSVRRLFRRGCHGWLAIVVVLCACSVPASAARSSPPPAETAPPAAAPKATSRDVTSRVGLKFRDPAIASALDLFDEGKIDEAIDSLYKLVQDSGQQDEARKRELQVAAAMLEIRSGDRRRPDSRDSNFAKGLSKAKNYAKDWGDADIGIRAGVIALTGGKATNDGTPKYEKLGPQAKWIERLQMVSDDLERNIRSEDKRLLKSIGRATLPNAEDALRKLAKYVEQRNAIELDRNSMMKVMTAHAGELDTAVHRLNDLLSDMIADAKALKQACSRANRRTFSTARDKANEAIKAAEQCRAVLEVARDTQGRLCRLFPDTCDFKPVQPEDVPDRVR